MLNPIIQQKKEEVKALYLQLREQPQHPLVQFLDGMPQQAQPRLTQTLMTNPFTVIAEIKRQSPSRGSLASISDPVELAMTYTKGGAQALSILTDHRFFGGHLTDLSQIAQHSITKNLPLLRKDFIIDKIQIAEAAMAGASTVLAIVNILQEPSVALNLQEFLKFADTLNLDVIVEVHNAHELKQALDDGAKIIGINNRDLRSFTVNTQTAFNLKPHIPDDRLCIAESGIHHPQLAQQYRDHGFRAVLIGEALVTSSDPAGFICSCLTDRSMQHAG